MKQLVIRVFDVTTDKLETTIAIPLQVFRMASSFLPASAVAALQAQGLEVEQIQQALAKRVETGRLLEIQRPDRRLVISIEQTPQGVVKREAQ